MPRSINRATSSNRLRRIGRLLCKAAILALARRKTEGDGAQTPAIAAKPSRCRSPPDEPEGGFFGCKPATSIPLNWAHGVNASNSVRTSFKGRSGTISNARQAETPPRWTGSEGPSQGGKCSCAPDRSRKLSLWSPRIPLPRGTWRFRLPVVVEGPARTEEKPAPIEFEVLSSRTEVFVSEAAEMPDLPRVEGKIKMTIRRVADPGLPDPPPALPVLPPDDPAVLARLAELRELGDDGTGGPGCRL
jgi:hypothetical protein